MIYYVSDGGDFYSRRVSSSVTGAAHIDDDQNSLDSGEYNPFLLILFNLHARKDNQQ